MNTFNACVRVAAASGVSEASSIDFNKSSDNPESLVSNCLTWLSILFDYNYTEIYGIFLTINVCIIANIIPINMENIINQSIND